MLEFPGFPLDEIAHRQIGGRNRRLASDLLGLADRPVSFAGAQGQHLGPGRHGNLACSFDAFLAQNLGDGVGQAGPPAIREDPFHRAIQHHHRRRLVVMARGKKVPDHLAAIQPEFIERQGKPGDAGRLPNRTGTGEAVQRLCQHSVRRFHRASDQQGIGQAKAQMTVTRGPGDQSLQFQRGADTVALLHLQRRQLRADPCRFDAGGQHAPQDRFRSVGIAALSIPQRRRFGLGVTAKEQPCEPLLLAGHSSLLGTAKPTLDGRTRPLPLQPLRYRDRQGHIGVAFHSTGSQSFGQLQRCWPPAGCRAPRPLRIFRCLARPIAVEFQSGKV